MAKQVEEYAAQLQKTSADFGAMLERLSDDVWSAKTPEEGWTVAATARHAAGSLEPISMFVRLMATKQPMPPLTTDWLEEQNQKNAKEFASCSKQETLDALRKNTAAAEEMLRGLDDAQLQIAGLFLGHEMTTQAAIEGVLIGHIAGHGASIAAAAGATA
jgi:uncharacterized damage-inducible protein DinB